MNDKIQTELDKLKEIITKTLPIDQIYLFGSYAYGNPHKDSDLDLYIVLKDEVEMRESDAAIQIRMAIADHQTMPLDIITTKKSRYLWLKNGPTMERKIAREGIKIYG
jgi:predicted nucleotidyltransferase